MIDNDPSTAANEADCPRCAATTAAAKAEIGLVAKACIEQLGGVADDIIGLIREAHATERAALHAWKAATDLSGGAAMASLASCSSPRATWPMTFPLAGLMLSATSRPWESTNAPSM